MPPIDRTLANGIRFLAEPIAATKAVAIGFWFSRGSRDEDSASHGITHFIEHMLFKGTATRSARDIARFFDRIGGYVNAFTEHELMCVYCVVPAYHALASAELVLSLLQESVFSDFDIEKERSVIVSELLSSQDDSEEMAMDAALAAMYPGHGLSRPIGGTVKEVETLESDRIRGEYYEQFREFPPVITVAGNIDAEYFESFLATKEYSEQPQEILKESTDGIPYWQAGHFYPVSPFGQSQIFLSWPLEFERSGANWFAWSAINAIIGDSVSSRLFQTLREEKGLCYSVYSTFAVNRDSALWSAYAATPSERTVETIETLMTELESVRERGFTDGEIADARLHIAGEMLLAAEDIENRMKRLGRQHFYNGILYSVEASIALLESLHDDDIQNRVHTGFSRIQESLVVYTGKKWIKECRKLWQ